MLKKFSHLEWLAVDHWPAGYTLFPPERGTRTQEEQVRIRSSYMAKVRKFSPRITVIEQPSVEAAAQISDKSLDLVFIDDDHSYGGCRASIKAWLPKVRYGGWLSGHDYGHPGFPGVAQAVNEILPNAQTGGDYTWFIQVSPNSSPSDGKFAET